MMAFFVESSDEGIVMSSQEGEDHNLEELRSELITLRVQLDRERRLRMVLEERNRDLETQLYPERIRQLANQVQAQMTYRDHKQVGNVTIKCSRTLAVTFLACNLYRQEINLFSGNCESFLGTSGIWNFL